MSNIHKRGFASLDPARMKEVASSGGKKAHELGRAHRFDSVSASEAGRKGGQVRAANRAKRLAEQTQEVA